MAWCWGGEDSHREAEKFLDLMEREEMERLQPAVYGGANHVAGEIRERTQLEEVSQKDLSEELDGAEEGIQLFDDFLAKIHQETETANDLQRICEEVHGAEAQEIELSKDNIAIPALNEDLDRANKKIESLMCWGGEDSHREAEKFLDLMEREEMERLQPAVYGGANHVAGEIRERTQLEEVSQKDLSEELDGAEEGIQLFDDFLAKIHQEAETANDLQRICEEVHGAEAQEIELSKDNIAISALNENLERANKKIESLMVSPEKAENQNDELREDLLVKRSVQVGEIESSMDNIAISALNEDLYRANKEIESIMVSLEKAENQNDELREELLVKKSVQVGEIESSMDNIAISALIEDLYRANKEIESIMVSLEKAENQNNELREELLVKRSVQVGEIESSMDNIAISALNEDIDRANKKIESHDRANTNIESLMVSLEKAEARNDQIRDELLVKVAVEKELENAHEEIRMLEKRLEKVTGDLETANKKLWEKRLGGIRRNVKAEYKRVKSENVLQKATLESEHNAAVEEVYRIGTKLNTVLDENSKLKTELLIKKDVVCDLEMAEEELEKLWKEIAGVKAGNRRLKRDLSEERATKNMLVKADEKNKKLEEEIRNLTSVADEFAIYKEKYQDMMERNMNLEMELNHKNYAITQLVDSLSNTPRVEGIISYGNFW
ncbi:flagellar attachment zone protein 1-like [Palaemon carinicauda]|uniref:flagellar attachment zone protein 1-like n=1 Tax=Palaemon carinicauda TaxID=392227 RepID=UPI0035B690F3